MGKGKKKDSDAKRKAVTIEPLSRKDKEADRVHAWAILDHLLETRRTHADVEGARFALAFQTGNIKQDVDGTVGFGKVKRGTDLDRAYSEYDLVLIIPKQVWQASDAARRTAIIDHLLCYCSVVKDANGEVVEDEKGRNVYRLRKPTKVFPENVAAFGFWQQEKLGEVFARYKDRDRPLLPKDKDEAPARAPGFGQPAMGKHKTNGHAKRGDLPWRELKIEVLELPSDVHAKLKKAKLGTFGALEELEAEKGQIGLADILGSERADTVREAVKLYRDAHPDLQEAAQS